MKKVTDGLVIWEVKTGEADRVITLLTPEGVLTAYARSSLKPGGKLTGPTAMLAFSNYELSSGKNMYTVADATSTSRHLKLRNDAVSYALAVYFCELLKLLAPAEEEQDTAEEYLRAMLNALYLLDGSLKPLWQIKGVMELTLMTLAGYMPNLEACSVCGSTSSDSAFFDPVSAQWTCSDCCARLGIRPNAPFSAIEAMRYVTYSEPRKAFSFSLQDSAASAFSYCCEMLVRSHIDHRLPTLDFYHSMAD